MLINRQYFTGELNIENSQLPLQQRLDHFIEKYEPELLRDILGYPLYNALIESLAVDTLTERRENLILGKEYTAGGILHKWEGLISIPQSVIDLSYNSFQSIVVGRGQEYDPLPASTSVAIPADLLSKPFRFEQRYFGTMNQYDYTIEDGVLTLLKGAIFSLGDTFFYRTSPLQFATIMTEGGKSLIANYVYYKYMRDQATQSTAVGEVSTKTENSYRVSPAQKMVSAWNEMVYQIHKLWHYLDNNRLLYPEWRLPVRAWNEYRTINTMNL